MAIKTDGAGRPVGLKSSSMPVRDPKKAAEIRQKRAKLLRQRRKEAGIVATEPTEVFAVADKGLSRLEADDVLIDRAEEWYLKGLTKPRELAALLKQDPDFVREELIPAVLRRLAAEKSPEERRAAAGAAVGRYQVLLKYAWNELHRAGKASVKAQWAQVVMNANREIDKVSGASTGVVDAKALQMAVNAFAERVVQIAESTNDPALMHRIEDALGSLMRNKDVPIEADFTEIQQQ